jgi:hypothetical protein
VVIQVVYNHDLVYRIQMMTKKSSHRQQSKILTTGSDELFPSLLRDPLQTDDDLFR